MKISTHLSFSCINPFSEFSVFSWDKFWTSVFFFFSSVFFFPLSLFIYLRLCWVFISVRGLSLVVASRGHSSSWCAGLFTIAASLVAEHRLQMRRLSNYGSWAQLLRGMWDLPRPGLEPVCPALAGRFSTTAPPGKPGNLFILFYFFLTFLLEYNCFTMVC